MCKDGHPTTAYLTHLAFRPPLTHGAHDAVRSLSSVVDLERFNADPELTAYMLIRIRELNLTKHLEKNLIKITPTFLLFTI